ncbi:MAG: hypothetical protein IKY74_04400 [Alistipes sp.]|nr:hypothetical protein [Alistipes sp.]
MKQFIYTLLAAVALFSASCEPVIITENHPDLCFYFGNVAIEATDNEATLEMAKPYVTIDGVKDESATFSISYWEALNEASISKMTEYTTTESGNVRFTLTNLKAETKYFAYIIVECSYGSERDGFEFVTQKHKPEISTRVKTNFDLNKGLFATVNLSEIEYKVDGKDEAIAFVKFEYKYNNGMANNEWVTQEYAGSSINAGRLTIDIPMQGHKYLVERGTYDYRIIFVPENSDLETRNVQEREFQTSYANITSEFSAPIVSLKENYIEASILEAEVFYDGISANDYDSASPFYGFAYREKGSDEWVIVEAERKSNGITTKIARRDLVEGATYEIRGHISAGANKTICTSNIAEVTITSNDQPVTPDQPIVPEPPVGGDTSTIEGVWHLTTWRGVTPSFEVYLDITATGGITLYQCIENSYWEVFQSAASIEDGIIQGLYTDGTAWATSYYLTVDGDAMTWVDSNDPTDISIYSRAELPAQMPTQGTTRAMTSTKFL